MTSGELQEALVTIVQLTPAEEVFNLAAALTRYDGDLSHLQKLAVMLNEDAPRLVAQIRDAVDGKTPLSWNMLPIGLRDRCSRLALPRY